MDFLQTAVVAGGFGTAAYVLLHIGVPRAKRLVVQIREIEQKQKEYRHRRWRAMKWMLVTGVVRNIVFKFHIFTYEIHFTSSTGDRVDLTYSGNIFLPKLYRQKSVQEELKEKLRSALEGKINSRWSLRRFANDLTTHILRDEEVLVLFYGKIDGELHVRVKKSERVEVLQHRSA